MASAYRMSGEVRRFLVQDLFNDVRQAFRVARRQPNFAAAAIITLALGIGATTAIFSVVDGVLIKPLRYPDSEALVRIVHSIGGTEQPYFNDAIYTTYADSTQAFQDVGVWSPDETATVTGQGDPEEVRVLKASRGVLTTLGVQPEIGRWFSKADDTPGSADTVMLSYSYWQRTFGRDRAVVSRVLTLNSRPHHVIGVMPPDFHFDEEFDVILPLRVDRGRLIAPFRLLGVARMKPGVTLEQANADAARVLQVWFETFKVNPAVRSRWAPSLRSLKRDVVGDAGRTLWVLMGAIGVVLLLACANVANLLLVRANGRLREFAIRAAVGARPWRLARHLLVESLTLAVVAGIVGIGFAYGGLRLLIAIAPPQLPRLDELSIDLPVLGFALGISLVSGTLFGLLPVLRYARPRFEDVLGVGRATPTRQRQRVQRMLVAGQLALALVLLVCAGLMIRSFQALRDVRPGFTESSDVQTFTISIPPSMVPEPERVTRVQQAILDAIVDIPGVGSASFTTRLPMGDGRSSAALAVEGRADDGRTPPNRQVKIISPGMFQTLGVALVTGRDFTWTDLYENRAVAIVSENLAREYWGSPAAALGKRVREYYVSRSRWLEVVGVAGDVYDDGADRPPPPTVYWPAQPAGGFFGMSGFQARRVSIVLRTNLAGTEGLLDQIREAVWSISPNLPLSQVRTLDDLYDRSLARTSFTLVMLATAGGVAVLLGMCGIYGVIAYAVSQRRREIGIRLALGAQTREIRELFLRDGLLVVAAGITLGLLSTAAMTRVMRSLLFGVDPLDPVAFTVMTIVLAAAAILASYLPARRALSVDPVETMRAE